MAEDLCSALRVSAEMLRDGWKAATTKDLWSNDAAVMLAACEEDAEAINYCLQVDSDMRAAELVYGPIRANGGRLLDHMNKTLERSDTDPWLDRAAMSALRDHLGGYLQKLPPPYVNAGQKGKDHRNAVAAIIWRQARKRLRQQDRPVGHTHESIGSKFTVAIMRRLGFGDISDRLLETRLTDMDRLPGLEFVRIG